MKMESDVDTEKLRDEIARDLILALTTTLTTGDESGNFNRRLKLAAAAMDRYAEGLQKKVNGLERTCKNWEIITDNFNQTIRNQYNCILELSADMRAEANKEDDTGPGEHDAERT